LQELGKATKTLAEARREEAATENQLLDNRIKQYEADNGISLKDIQKNKDKIFEVEAAERAHVESTQPVREYNQMRKAFLIMKTASKDAAGDDAMLTAFTKLGDADSIVSVAEKGVVRNVTLSDYVGSLKAKLTGGGSLPNEKRNELKAQGLKMVNIAQDEYEKYQDKLKPGYLERKLNPKNIFVLPDDRIVLEEIKKEATTVPAGAPGIPISTGNVPVAPAGRVYTIDGFDMKIVPRKK